MTVRGYDILIVDDDRTCGAVLEHQLRRLSFTSIDMAEDGTEALNCISAKHYDLIFLENNMPNMSGLEFLRRCKGVPILDGTSVIMLTGMADGETLRAVRDEGLKVDDFIVKPLDSDVLKAKLDRLGGHIASWSESSRNGETGSFLSIQLEVDDTISALRLFGIMDQDGKVMLKDIPDRVAVVPSGSIIIDMRNVVAIDDFGIGMVLLINGVACMAKKRPFLQLDGLTVKTRLESLGFGKVMRIIEHASEAMQRAPVAAA